MSRRLIPLVLGGVLVGGLGFGGEEGLVVLWRTLEDIVLVFCSWIGMGRAWREECGGKRRGEGGDGVGLWGGCLGLIGVCRQASPRCSGLSATAVVGSLAVEGLLILQ